MVVQQWDKQRIGTQPHGGWLRFKGIGNVGIVDARQYRHPLPSDHGGNKTIFQGKSAAMAVTELRCGLRILAHVGASLHDSLGVPACAHEGGADSDGVL